MPRRPLYANTALPLRARIREMFADPRTWSTLLYFVLMLPLGIVYFTLAVVGIVLSISLTLAPLAQVLWSIGLVRTDVLTQIDFNGSLLVPPALLDPLVLALGVAMLFGTLHLARGVGKFQGALAKHLLVKATA